jgi:hypothetical protein
MTKSNTPQLKNTEGSSDFHYAAQISLWLLKPMGVWPLHPHPTISELIVQGLSIAGATFFQLFMIIPWYISIITQNWSFYDVVRTACPLIFVNTVFLRYLLLLFHRNAIRSCINRVAEDWQNVVLAKHREIMLSNAKSGRFFGIISTAFMFGSGLPYCFMPLLLPPITNENNMTIKSFPNPNELIFVDVQVNSMYEFFHSKIASAL